MEKSQDVFGKVISVYTQEEAIEDGVLVPVGRCGHYSVIFTSNLFHDGYEDKEARITLIERGVKMLNDPDPEDTSDMRLRVIERDKIWVILDGNGITFMQPSDY